MSVHNQRSAVQQPKWVFLFPEASLNDGGHLAQQKFFDLSSWFYDARFVTYEKRHPDYDFLSTWLAKPAECDDAIYCVHYGPHINTLLERLKGRRVVYFAHSTGWGFDLPAGIPIISVSKHSQAYWGRHAPANPGYCVPNIISDSFYNPECKNPGHQRAVDVLVVKRKMSSYLIDSLVPNLPRSLNVKVIDSWVDDLSAELRDAKVFLYDSNEHWCNKGVSEGFGLPPLEALASGCQVFSSINDALSDYLSPAVNCWQLGSNNVQYDSQRIVAAVEKWRPATTDYALAYREVSVGDSLQRVFSDISHYFLATGSVCSGAIISRADSDSLTTPTILRGGKLGSVFSRAVVSFASAIFPFFNFSIQRRRTHV